MFQQRLHGGATAFPKLAKPEWECCPLQHRVYSLTRDLVLAGTWEKDSKFISCGLVFFFYAYNMQVFSVTAWNFPLKPEEWAHAVRPDSPVPISTPDQTPFLLGKCFIFQFVSAVFFE